ncbi:MAG: EFR1 family ferrodoxin [Candidatus Neomarinimicrobiota bacterium]
MKIELRYFSGTGNSWTLLNTTKEIFEEAGHHVCIKQLDSKEQDLKADLIGFAFPTYAFGIPHVVRDYLSSLKIFENKQKVFVIITAGAVKGACSSTKVFEKLLSKKNAEVVFSDVIKMPNNWIPFSETASAEENKIIVQDAKARVREIAKTILAEEKEKFDLKQISRPLRFLGTTVNVLFRLAGLKFLKGIFNVYDSCDGCGLCAQTCPTKSIEMQNGKPIWTGDCEQCMRCVHICPQQAIYQKMGGHTKGKDRYLAPDFDPLKQ